MSRVDASLPQEQYNRMLEAVRWYLPSYLSGAAKLRRGAIEDLKSLLRLEDLDVQHLLAVHAALTPEAVAFVNAAHKGLRRPVLATTRERSVTQSVRGAVDWSATVRERARSGNDRTRFAVSAPSKDLDGPANAVAIWVFQRLRRMVHVAGGASAPSQKRDDPDKWQQELHRMAATLQRIAREQPWLAQIEPPRPTTRQIARLATSASSFHRRYVRPAALSILRAEQPDPQALTDLLCQTYFEPDRAWQLFELYVALEIVEALDAPERGLMPLPRRLIRGATESSAFATYATEDDGSLSLSYQGWPKRSVPSQRAVVAGRHGLKINNSIPDVLIIRRDADEEIVDVVVLELKASHEARYLAGGLSQLLGYLGEQPQLFPGTPPSAWLVAPESRAFADAPTGNGPLWMVTAERVGQAVADRFAPL